MGDKIELGEPDSIRNEDNILWLRAEIERLKAVVDLAFAYRNASFSDQEDIGLELDTALEGADE